MQLGSYEIPEIRLVPEAIELLRKIQPTMKDETIQSKDLAILLGYKYGTETQFYRKLKSMIQYGILEGKGAFKITNLGKDILNPINQNEEKKLRTQAVLNVPIWNDIYKKYQRNVAADNFWVILMNITSVQRDEAKKNEGKIYKWYNEDMNQVHDELIGTETNDQTPQSEPLRSMPSQVNQMSQQMTHADVSIPNDYERFEFGKTVIAMPKTNIKKEWDKAKKMLDIYLEDYEESKDPLEHITSQEATDEVNEANNDLD